MRDYEKMYYDSVKNHSNSKIIREWRTKSDELVKFLEKVDNKKNKKVLELGSGRGFLTKYLTSLGFNLTGSDFNKHNIKLANEINRIKLKHIDATKINEKKDSFDIVISCELIEHLPNVEINIKEVRRVLKKDGFYCITTPNRYIERLYNLLTGKVIDKYHISLQTHKSLRRLLENEGFSVKFIKMRGFTKSQKEKLGHNECEICGIRINLHVHHEKPKKTHPHLSLDPDNGIILCGSKGNSCHSKYGHKDKCSTGNLSHKLCI